MSPYSPLLTVAVLAAGGGAGAAEAPLTLAREGWTLTADGERGLLTVSHDRLGAVRRSARLNLRRTDGLRRWASWSVEKVGTRQLLFRTAGPATVWIVEPGLEALRVSCTSSRAVPPPPAR